MQKPSVALILDTRRPVEGGLYPVKVRVSWQTRTDGHSKTVSRYVKTRQYMSESDFKVVERGRAKGTLKDQQTKIFAIRNEVSTWLDDQNYIGVHQFDAKYKGKTTVTAKLRDLFQEVIDEKKAIGKLRTSASYAHAMNSICEDPDLQISDIDSTWLKNYETRKLAAGMSLNSIGIYLRTLKAVINRNRHLISDDQYPFGKEKYVIRKKRTVKKPIPKDVKDRLVAFVPTIDAESAAKDYALFSYYANGMNFTDMAYLRVENFRPDYFKFIRRKTKDTVHEQVEIIIPISTQLRDILDRRGKHKPYVFGIINDDMDAEARQLAIYNWISRTNKWLKKIAISLGYHEKISIKWLRHTFTSILLNAGVPLTKVKDALGHTAITTTQNYAEDLDLESSKDFQKIL
jgi:integrase